MVGCKVNVIDAFDLDRYAQVKQSNVKSAHKKYIG